MLGSLQRNEIDGYLLHYMDKKQKGHKKCRNETKKIISNLGNKYVTQQINQCKNMKKMNI